MKIVSAKMRAAFSPAVPALVYGSYSASRDIRKACTSHISSSDSNS